MSGVIYWVGIGSQLGSCPGTSGMGPSLEAAGYRLLWLASVESLKQVWLASPGEAEAVVVCVPAAADRPEVQAVLRALEHVNASPPLLVGGGGVDADFALDVAASARPAPYRGGVLYWENEAELLHVLRNVVSLRPAAAGHAHSHRTMDSSCSSCSECGSCASGATDPGCGQLPCHRD